MPEEIPLRKPGEGASKDGVGEKKVDATPAKVEPDDSSKKIEELEIQRAKDKAEADAKIAKLEFESNFKDMVAEYPHAAEFKDKILEKVNAGISIKDATTIVLHGEGKLVTRSQIESDVAGERSLGGSMDTPIPKGKKPISEMTIEEQRAELVEQERIGNFGLTD